MALDLQLAKLRELALERGESSVERAPLGAGRVLDVNIRTVGQPHGQRTSDGIAAPGTVVDSTGRIWLVSIAQVSALRSTAG